MLLEKRRMERSPKRRSIAFFKIRIRPSVDKTGFQYTYWFFVSETINCNLEKSMMFFILDYFQEHKLYVSTRGRYSLNIL